MQKNIALLTMSLDIGGAETHIYELACELASRGNKVTVFSAGGVYVNKLSQRGIAHITAPLNTKNPIAIATSVKIVGEYVKAHPDCILHSHTRISNFVSNIVSKMYNVPFVSTIHGIYKFGPAQRVFSKWGNRVLAVSEDRRSYAVDCYDYDTNKIRVTVNGINLDTFKKRTNEQLKAQLGLENSKVILCVTRLDTDGCEHVYKLFEVASELYKNDNSIKILIVGTGKKENDLIRVANEINKNTQPDFIRFAGARTDINKLLNIADVFVGISRSALEAMASEVPTVLLGNSGYIGLFSEQTKNACIETNFTCRGYNYPLKEELVKLITDMLKNPQDYSENVKAGLELVKSRYSILRMTEDALLSYSEATNDVRPYDVMLCGYYGRHNLGDDMLLKALHKNLTDNCGVKKTALITSDTKDNTSGCDVLVHRFNLLKIYSLMKKTKTFVLGGGSILQDATSSRSIFYYLHILKKALKLCPSTMLYSNGVGPIKRNRFKKLTSKLLNKVNLITVRNQKSVDFLQEIGVTNKNVYLSADETFTLTRADFKKEYPLVKGKQYLGINLRDLRIDFEFIEAFAKFVDAAAKGYGLVPILIPIHYEQDMPVLSALADELKTPHILISERLQHEKTLSILSQCHVSVLERLHAIIFSSIFETPYIAIDYDPKVKSVCDEMGMSEFILSLDKFDVTKACKKFDMLMQNREDICAIISERVIKSREMAKINSECAKQLLV